jgi:hypothetical protein
MDDKTKCAHHYHNEIALYDACVNRLYEGDVFVREYCKLGMYGNRVMRMFGPKREKVIG